MKRWQEFLLLFVCFVVADMSFELIKYVTEQGFLPGYAVAWILLGLFVLGWTIVFRGTKSLKSKKTTTKNIITVGFAYFMLFWSVYMTFEIMQYFLENNFLNHWYFFGVGVIFMFIGWAGGYLTNILSKSNKYKPKGQK